MLHKYFTVGLHGNQILHYLPPLHLAPQMEVQGREELSLHVSLVKGL